MPAKKPPPKTKKQLKEEAKQKALEEKRLKEEQERKQKEEEEKKRLEELRIQKELEEKLAAEEAQRLTEEQDEYILWDNDYPKKLEALKDILLKGTEEAKRLEANFLPDPKNIKDLNAYLALWHDEQEESLEDCVNNCQKAEKIAQQIIDMLYASKCEEDEKLITWSIDYLKKIQDQAMEKIDEVTLFILENVEKYLLRTEEEKSAILNKKASDKKDEDPTYKNERLYKSVMTDVAIGMYINRNNRVYKPLPVEFEDVRGHVEMPRNLCPANAPPEVMIRSVWTAFDNLSFESFSPLIPVGGIIRFDIYKFNELFPNEQKVWMVRQIYDIQKTLTSIPYPDPKSLLIGQTVPPLQVLIKLPEYVFIMEDDALNVALWDVKTNAWTVEGIEEVKLDREKCHLEFRTTRLAPLAFVINRCIDYPYTSWYMRCTAPDTALLDLVTKRKRFIFEITPGQVKLIETEDPALAHITGKPFEPGLLLYELLKSGINLMPDDKDGESSGYKPKYKDAEERAIFELATSVNAFAFRSSVWNKSLNPEQVAMSIRLNLEYDREFFEKDEREWKTFIWYRNKCGYSKLNDGDKECNSQLQDNCVNHLWFCKSIQGMYSEEAIDRCRHISQISFFETIRKFLRLVRITSFC